MKNELEKKFISTIKSNTIDKNKYKGIIEIMTNITEIVFEGGLLSLDMINKGYIFTIDGEDRLVNQLKDNMDKYSYSFSNYFGDLVFMSLTQQRDCGMSEIVVPDLLINYEGEEFIEKFILYKAILMISNFTLPWELKYVLCRYIGIDVDIESIFKNYLHESETYTMCINRYLNMVNK